MKKILTILLLTVLCSFLNAQNTFQKTYPFFSGEANGHLIITQSDGYTENMVIQTLAIASLSIM